MKLNQKICVGSLLMIAQDSSAKTTLKGGLLNHRGISLACMFVFIAGLGLGAPLVVADEDDDFPTNLEGIAPLRSLLALVHDAYPGHVLEVELEQEEYGRGDVWVYEVKLLTTKGSVLELEYDAITLELLKMKGRQKKSPGEERHCESARCRR